MSSLEIENIILDWLDEHDGVVDNYDVKNLAEHIFERLNKGEDK